MIMLSRTDQRGGEELRQAHRASDDVPDEDDIRADMVGFLQQFIRRKDPRQCALIAFRQVENVEQMSSERITKLIVLANLPEANLGVQRFEVIRGKLAFGILNP